MPTSPVDLELVLARLAQSEAALREALGGVSAGQWVWKPDAETWSIGEIAEHLWLVERGIVFGLRTAPADSFALTEGKEQLLARLESRSQRLAAPERVLPRGKFQSREECLEGLAKVRVTTLAWAQDPGTHLLDHVMRHPAFGEMHGVQWLEMIAMHTLRHIGQIRDLTGLPAYPKN